MQLKAVISFSLIFLLSGCYYLQSPSTPMETVSYLSKNGTDKNNSQRKLMVLLPGIGDGAEKFYQHGVVDMIQHKYPDMDVIAVNAHLKYYQARTITEQLRTDIIKPARDAGYQEIYLGGISLGGFGSLLYLRQYPEDIAKAFIMAPYLGEAQDYDYLLADSTKEISTTAAPTENSIWLWLTSLPDVTRQKIYLAYGAEDKFATSNNLLAKYISPEQVLVQRGKHHWKTWEQLWPALLAKPDVAKQ
ncbi:MAG: alpha/beta hydrolase-fold protein [Cellvibrio sp.]|uniref:alpha/beta hydrolase-fold protein n=1 Tax=Cellvibrio sp. TaxID=1965322 RepID=UPI0031AA8442